MREPKSTDEPVSDMMIEDDGAASDFARTLTSRQDGKPPRRQGRQRFRVARGMYEVADTWEKVYLLATPAICVTVFCQTELGVPIRLRGFLFLAVAVYLGSCFMFLVVIERRYAQRQHRRSKGGYAARIDTLNEQRIARRAETDARVSRRQRDLAAQQRGAERAAMSGQPAAADDQLPAAAETAASSSAFARQPSAKR